MACRIQMSQRRLKHACLAGNRSGNATKRSRHAPCANEWIAIATTLIPPLLLHQKTSMHCVWSLWNLSQDWTEAIPWSAHRHPFQHLLRLVCPIRTLLDYRYLPTTHHRIIRGRVYRTSFLQLLCLIQTPSKMEGTAMSLTDMNVGLTWCFRMIVPRPNLEIPVVSYPVHTRENLYYCLFDLNAQEFLLWQCLLYILKIHNLSIPC